METPFIRAKAKDMVDSLDNVTAYSESSTRDEIVEFVRGTLGDIHQVLARAEEAGVSPTAAYTALVARFNQYWDNPPA